MTNRLLLILHLLGASLWIGGWGSVLSTSTPARPLVFTKLALLAVILVFAAHASRRVLPRLTPDTLGRFAIHAWIVTVLSVALLVFGIGVRMGGLY